MTTDLVPWPRPLVVVVNRTAYSHLTRSQREALASAGHAALDAAMQTVRDDDSEGTGILCSKSVAKYFSLVVSSPAQRAAMRRAVAPVYAVLERDRSVAALIRGIEAMKATAKSDAPIGCPALGNSGRARTPIDGVFIMDSSAADIPAARRATDPASVWAENLGHWVFAFDRGRFANTQGDKDACTWVDGRYTVKGHTMRWIVTAGGGIAPNGAVNKPGQDFKFTWSRYRDTLTVGRVKGATSPDSFYRRPWHRDSASPSNAPFDERCPPPANWASQ
jgi:hypothetical protein